MSYVNPVILYCCLDLLEGGDINHSEITVVTASPMLPLTQSVVSVGTAINASYKLSSANKELKLSSV